MTDSLPQSGAAPAPPADPPRPMPFAIARNCHEALRGGLKDCKAAVESGDLETFTAEWNDYCRACKVHAEMEDLPGGMFAMMDERQVLSNSTFISNKLSLSNDQDSTLSGSMAWQKNQGFGRLTRMWMAWKRT
jgi:hypothetical protein